MRKIIAVFVGFLAFSISTAVFAVDYKVGIVDVNKVLASTPQVEAMKTKLKNQFEPKMKDVTAREKTLKADLEKYKKDSSIMTAKERDALKNKIEKEQDKVIKLRSNFQKNFMEAQNQAQQTILKQIQDAVNSVGAKQKFDLIFVKDTVAFNLPTFDITDLVIELMKK
jgi:outer membrane protein